MPLPPLDVLHALFAGQPITVERAPGASTVPTLRVQVGDAAWAVKLYGDPAPAQGQAALLHWLRAAGLPAPTAEVRQHGGVFALLTPWLPGQTLAAAVGQMPWRAAEWGRRLGQIHAALHALPVSAEARAALPPTGGWPQAQDDAVLHLDLHPLNVLVGSDPSGAPQITALLDWENVRLGPPRADVARTLSILSVGPAVLALPAPARAAVRRLRRGYLAGYGEAGGEIGGLAPSLAWAGAFLMADLSGHATPLDLAPARRWTAYWTRQAGRGR